MGKHLRIRAACASLASRSKQLESKICEDAVGKAFTNGIAAIILSDGAGSRKHSATGARTVVRLLKKTLTRDFDDLVELVRAGEEKRVASALLHSLHEELGHRKFAAVEGVDEYASTILFAATDKRHLLLGQLGDGGIVLCSSNTKLVFEPSRGEFVNQTCFTTSSTAVSDFQLKVIPLDCVYGVVVFSDGVASSVIENGTGVVAPAIKTMVGWLQENKVNTVEEALLENLRCHFIQRTHDDCAIGILAFS